VRRELRLRLRHTAILTTKTGDAFRGVLWATDRDVFVLRNCEHLDRQTSNVTAVDGEVVVLVADVAYVQFP
jgi:small nuclear ribonucleoprotein (snRNP)-like protein